MQQSSAAFLLQNGQPLPAFSVSQGSAGPHSPLQRGGKEQAPRTPGTPVKKPGPTIALIAKVVRFDQAASWDDHDDGSFAVYPRTMFEILSPKRLSARQLVVYHGAPVPPDSPLRAVGKKVRFRIEEKSLDPALQLFTGTIEGIVLQAEEVSKTSRSIPGI